MKKVFATLILVMAMSVFPASAFAAEPIPTNLLISLWPEYSNNQIFFMQQIELSKTEALPATVRFAFPLGVQMQWTGEIMGSDTTKDIQATPVITQKDGYQEVAITLTKSRTAQAEAIWDGLKINGKERSITLAWTQRYESLTTTFEFLEPSKASKISMTPPEADTRKSADGYTYHLSAPKVIAVGQTMQFDVTYNRSITTPTTGEATAGAAATQTGAKSNNLVSNWVLVLIFVAAGAGIGTFVYRESKKS
jgi:hypothetical protein